MTGTARGRAEATHEVELAVLGPFQAWVAGQWQEPPTRQVGRVATVLAGWPGETVERDRIIAGVWGEDTPATVINTLQVHISHLRRLLGKAAVRAQGTGYVLDLPPEAVDAEQFVEAVQEAARMRRLDHLGRAAELLATATDLWRGTPFPDVLDPDLEARRARLAELRDQAREDLLACRLELCRDRLELGEVIADLKELVSRQPLRESGHALLVRALAAADRPGEASAAFEAASDLLRSRLGLDPGRDLVHVHARVLTHDDALLPRAMRRVAVVPDLPIRLETGIGQRVREAVVDAGARVVVIEESDVERARAAAGEVVRALAADFLAGVVLVDAADAEPGTLTAALSSATGLAPSEIVEGNGLGGLALVVLGAGGAVRGLLEETADRSDAPVLVLVGPAAEDLGAQLTITGTGGEVGIVR